jgi:DNA-directed RNA polymerase subunit RPC12/RpoP
MAHAKEKVQEWLREINNMKPIITKYMCLTCEHIFDKTHRAARPVSCPRCESMRIKVIETKQDGLDLVK